MTQGRLEISEGNTGRKRNRPIRKKRKGYAARLNEERGKITEREREERVTAAESSSGIRFP